LWNLRKYSVEKNGKFVDFSDPTQVWRRPGKKCLRVSTNDLYCRKLESLAYISATDSIGLCLLLFTQLSLKFEFSESKTASTKTQFYMIIATQGILGHSFCNQSQANKGWRIVIQILLVLCLNFPKKQPLKSPKIAVVNNPTLIWGPRQEEPTRVSSYTLYFQKLESLAYILVAACVGLSSFTFVQWAPKTHLFAHQSAFWPFKVIQGRWFWYQSKARIRLPISPSLWLWFYLALFLRCGDLLAKNCLFLLSLSYSSPTLPMFRLEFRGEVNRQETRVMGLQWRLHDRSWSRFGMIIACDRRSDGQTDSQTESIIANTALCIASYADAL